MVDKHLFGKGGKAGKTGVQSYSHSNSIDSATTMALMADVGRIRSELAFKCDGAFVKSTLEGKANKQVRGGRAKRWAVGVGVSCC